MTEPRIEPADTEPGDTEPGDTEPANTEPDALDAYSAVVTRVAAELTPSITQGA